jgi:hypothetical protein
MMHGNDVLSIGTGDLASLRAASSGKYRLAIWLRLAVSGYWLITVSMQFVRLSML